MDDNDAQSSLKKRARRRLVGAIAVNNTPALFRYRSELESTSGTALPTSQGHIS